MITATSTKPNKGRDRGKTKDKSKDNILCAKKNCDKTRHTSDQCWEKGGGKEVQAPDWWKKIVKSKKAKANIAEDNTAEKDKPNDYAMLTTFITESYDNSALTCTSDFCSEAHAASNQSGIIIDSGVSRHFSPDHAKFLNYKEFVNHTSCRQTYLPGTWKGRHQNHPT